METLQLEKKKRTFLPEDFKVSDWEKLKPYFEKLKSRDIGNVEALREWMRDRSELESVLEEDMGWRYIRMTSDIGNELFQKSFNEFVAQIQPHIAPYTHELNRKLLDSPFLGLLQAEPAYRVVVRLLEKDFKIFREKNIPLQTQLGQEEQKFGAVSGAMTVEVEGKELTLQQAADYLQKYDRAIREEVWMKISERRLQDNQNLDNLLSLLIKLRDELAKNADFLDYRGYRFVELGRFAYTQEDCDRFQEAVRQEVVPILKDLAEERKEKLELEHLRPWDLAVNYSDKEPLKPFSTGDELLEKTIECFERIDTYLADCLLTMKGIGHLDLVSRKGKAPGGYNYPLDETGIPFIFMNATSTLRDLVTLVHEGGHAFHSFLMRDLELNYFQHPPSEVAELASMSMELISMEHWDVFFSDEKDLLRAKREHLESIITTLPWVATVDKFQNWLYEHPKHTLEERHKEWADIFLSFGNQVTDWEGLGKYRDYVWQKQLHIYEVPFYYIEYGIAQLGAIAVWKNYKENREEGFRKYRHALSLGYTRPINELYEEAGVRFDFSTGYIRELMSFVRSEFEKCSID